MSKGIQIIKENNNLAECSRQVEEFRNSGLSVRSWCERHQIAVSTFHYRQEQELKQKGIELSRQTMSNWFITASKLWLEPLYERMKELLLKESVLHADETTLQVLKTKDKPTATKSYMWLYRTSGCSNTPIVLYDYKPNRKAKNPESFLKEFKGYLHTDG